MRTARPLAVLVATSSMLLCSPANADLSIAAFQRMARGTEMERFGIEMYVGGVVKGYLNANGFQGAVKQPPLFCYPGDLTTGGALKLAKQVATERLKAHPDDVNQEIMEGLLLMKLRELYPCK